jgi:NADH-quinone oxidoreductase subunit L
MLLGLAGLWLSYVMYAAPSTVPAVLAGRFRRLYRASVHKFGVDELYQAVFVQTTRGLAIVCGFLDDYPLDGLVMRVAMLPQTIGRGVLARYQNGLVQFYAAVSGLTVVVLLLILALLV